VPLLQSAPLEHPWPSPHFFEQLPPQSTSDSPPFFDPSPQWLGLQTRPPG